MTTLAPNHGDTGQPKGSRLDEMSPGFMAIDNAENATAMQRFIVKFQYKLENTNAAQNNNTDSTDTANQAHVTKTMTILSKLKQQFGDELKVLGLNGDMIDLQAITNQDYNRFASYFKYINRPNATRQNEVWLTVETTMTFGLMKRPMITWLQDNDLWMDLHGFGIQVLRTFNLGYLLAHEPRHIFRTDLQASINREIAYRMGKLTTNDRTKYYKDHGSKNTSADRAPPTIRVLFAATIRHYSDSSDMPTETRGLKLECDYDDRQILEQLLMEISQASSYLGIFVSSSMVKNNRQLDACRTILQAQNVTLQNHRIHSIAGIGANQMDIHGPTGQTLRQQLLALPGITRVERTPATPTIGKWLIFTNNDNFERSKQGLDHYLQHEYAQQDIPTQFHKFPRPIRLTAQEPPVEYVNAVLEVATKALSTTAPADIPNQAPNAWSKGPPKTTVDQTSVVGSTTTHSETQTFQTQMSELQQLIATSQKQIQDIKMFKDQMSQQLNQSTLDLDAKITATVESSFSVMMDKLLPRINQFIDEKLNQMLPRHPHPSPPPIQAPPAFGPSHPEHFHQGHIQQFPPHSMPLPTQLHHQFPPPHFAPPQQIYTPPTPQIQPTASPPQQQTQPQQHLTPQMTKHKTATSVPTQATPRQRSPGSDNEQPATKILRQNDNNTQSYHPPSDATKTPPPAPNPTTQQ